MRIQSLLITAVLVLPFAIVHAEGGAAVATAIAAGDEKFAGRAEGATGAIAKPEPIDAALVEYRKALSADPKSHAARWKLVRALHFRGAYCGAGAEDKKRFFAEGKALGDAGVALIETALAGKSGLARLNAMKGMAGAAELYMWNSVVWGEWALVFGKMAAARKGAAAKIRDLSQTVIDLDPALEEAGGYRVLGRLHDQSPKIPMVTGWINHKHSIILLRQAHAAAPANRASQFFLGAALLDHQRENKAEALEILKKCAEAPPRPDFLVEDRHYAAQAAQAIVDAK